MNLDHLFTLDSGSGFISESGDDLATGDIDDVTGRGIGDLPIQAEGDPSGLISHCDTVDICGRCGGRVEDVHPLIERITDPDLRFVRSQADAVTGTSMSFDVPRLKPGDFDAVQLFAGCQIADFKPQQFIDADETETLSTINRKGTDTGRKWPHLLFNCMR